MFIAATSITKLTYLVFIAVQLCGEATRTTWSDSAATAGGHPDKDDRSWSRQHEGQAKGATLNK